MTRFSELNWVFGNGMHLYFPGGGDPVAQLPIQGFSTTEGCAAISDESGKLLFYTDGSTLWDDKSAVVQTGLGGNTSSTHSAIIVPPAGGGNEYHIFAVGKTGAPANLITHSSYEVGATVTVAAPPQAIGTLSHSDAAERLAATSHADCDSYWVAAQNEHEQLILFLVKEDYVGGTLPQLQPVSAQPWATTEQYEFGQMKFSPNGEYLAYSDTMGSRVVVLGFDSYHGVFTEWLQIEGIKNPYGLEFSPNSKLLYYATLDTPSHEVRQVSIPATPATPTTPPFLNNAQHLVSNDHLGQLQLGPNNKIYGAHRFSHNLAVIENPDQPLAGYSYESIALDAHRRPLVGPGGDWRFGLPTFTRVADKCRTPDCAEIAADVDHMLLDAVGEHHESMQPCDYKGDDPWPHPTQPLDCEPLRFERPEPSVFVTHSDSDCDCLESDDVEVLNLTVCNWYSNITLTDLTIQSIELVGPSGGPPATLPDGSPSVEIAPIGPFCFGDIAPCSCVSRQFVLRMRGAVAGTYKLKLTAMCFAWQVSESQQRCFEFEVCAD